MGRPSLLFHELKGSTQKKYVQVNHTRVWDEQAQDIARSGSEAALRVFLFTLPIMRLANGYLEREGEPIESSDIARMIGLKAGDVGKALREIEKFKIFSRNSDKIYYSPRLVAFFEKNPEKSEKVNSADGINSEENDDKVNSAVKYSNSVAVGELSLAKLDSTDTNLQTDKERGDRAPTGASAGARPILTELIQDCWNIPGVSIAGEVTPNFVAGIAGQIGVADAPTSFRKLCASHVKSGQPVAVWNVEAWFKNEGNRGAGKQKPAEPQPTHPQPASQSDEPIEITIEI